MTQRSVPASAQSRRVSFVDYKEANVTALPYKWSQDLNTVTVNVPLPAGTRGKDLVVVMDKRKLKVSSTLRGSLTTQVQVKGAEQPIIEGELFEDIAKDDSSWTIGTFSMLTLWVC